MVNNTYTPEERKGCKKSLPRKIFLGLYVILILILVGLTTNAGIIYFKGEGDMDIQRYQLTGVNYGVIFAGIYAIYQIISKVEGKYKDTIRSQKLNEIHYMLARSILDTDNDTGNDIGNDYGKTTRFNNAYLDRLCEDKIIPTSEARVGVIHDIFTGDMIKQQPIKNT